MPADIISSLRKKMRSAKLDYILIRSTDEFFNEYVPGPLSRRQTITGFTGSVGDAVVGLAGAWLFVDGRYGLQANAEAKGFEVFVQPIGQTIEEGWVQFLSSQKNIKRSTIGFETDRLSMRLMDLIQAEQAIKSAKAKHLGAKFFDCIPQPPASKSRVKVWKVPAKLTGRTFEKRLKECQLAIQNKGLDGLIITPLDTIAWLTQLRGDEYSNQSLFSARAMLHPKGLLVGSDHLNKIKLGKSAEVVPLKDFEPAAKKLSKTLERVGYDPSNCSGYLVKRLKKAGFKLRAAASPLEEMKSIKTSQELWHMREGFHRADRVVHKTQTWAQRQVSQGKQISEADVSDYLHQAYLDSGARDLSFTSICGADENGAIIHYSKASPAKFLRPSTMFLMDSGGIYDGGYATDLTRTFFCGGSKDEPSAIQKELFTTVLKGAIAGMSARFPKGTNGTQLDAIVRAPIWQAGYNFAHGTGHGVGVNVHEFPPTISSRVKTELKAGQVFSIEPGIYLEGVGGVRIENLCTVISDPKREGFLQVLPLTFSPLDKRLMDQSQLTTHEKKFLKYFAEGFGLGANVIPSPMD